MQHEYKITDNMDFFENNISVLRAEKEWQRAGAYSVRIQGMNRQYHIPLREEFDEHDCDGTKYLHGLWKA